MKIVRNLQMLICKVFNIQYRHVLDKWELENIVKHDAKIYVCVTKEGVIHVISAHADSPLDHTAGNSLIYFLSREIYNFDSDVRARLKKLDQYSSKENKKKISLRQALESVEPNIKPVSLLEQFEQERENENEE